MSRAEIERRAYHLIRALKSTDIAVAYQNSDLKYEWIENPPEGFVATEIVGRSDFDLMPQESASKLVDAKNLAIARRTAHTLELDFPTNEGCRWFELWFDPEFDSAGTFSGMVNIVLDITGEKRKQESMKNLLLEVSHRSRNMLAIVQSLAHQSMHNAQDKRGVSRFTQRLQSLALTLDVVTSEEWDGASLHDLIERQSKPYIGARDKMSVTGFNPQLTPNAAVHIGLALHELMAHSHEQTCNVGGKKSIKIQALAPVSKQDNNSFVLEWRECIKSYHMGTSDNEMDSITLKKVVPRALSGTAVITHEGDEMLYSLTVPADNFK